MVQSIKPNYFDGEIRKIAHLKFTRGRFITELMRATLAWFPCYSLEMVYERLRSLSTISSHPGI